MEFKVPPMPDPLYIRRIDVGTGEQRIIAAYAKSPEGVRDAFVRMSSSCENKENCCFEYVTLTINGAQHRVISYKDALEVWEDVAGR